MDPNVKSKGGNFCQGSAVCDEGASAREGVLHDKPAEYFRCLSVLLDFKLALAWLKAKCDELCYHLISKHGWRQSEERRKLMRPLLLYWELRTSNYRRITLTSSIKQTCQRSKHQRELLKTFCLVDFFFFILLTFFVFAKIKLRNPSILKRWSYRLDYGIKTGHHF